MFRKSLLLVLKTRIIPRGARMSGENKVPCGRLPGEFWNDSTECHSSFFRTKPIPENMCRQQRDGPFDGSQTHLRYTEFVSKATLSVLM